MTFETILFIIAVSGIVGSGGYLIYLHAKEQRRMKKILSDSDRVWKQSVKIWEDAEVFRDEYYRNRAKQNVNLISEVTENMAKPEKKKTPAKKKPSSSYGSGNYGSSSDYGDWGSTSSSDYGSSSSSSDSGSSGGGCD